MAERIRTLYTADYIDNWRHGLNQLNVSDFKDVSHVVTVLENVSSPSAPFRRLLDTVRNNTLIYQPVVAATGDAKVEAESKLFEDPGREQAARIGRAFSALYDYMKSVQDSPDRGKAALRAVMNRFSLTGPDSIANLQRLANHYPFNSNGKTDAALEDFEAFFGRQGRLQQFQGQYLSVFLKDNLDALYSERRGGFWYASTSWNNCKPPTASATPSSTTVVH